MSTVQNLAPLDIFHPSFYSVERYCRRLRPQNLHLDRRIVCNIVISYLLKCGNTRESLLSEPPRSIAAVVDVCNCIFAADVAAAVREKLEGICETFGETIRAENGEAQKWVGRDSTLEDWIYALVERECKFYNGRMKRIGVELEAQEAAKKRKVWWRMRAALGRFVKRVVRRVDWRVGEKHGGV
ncbi:hypothetical protein DRE_04745 [Drechslerella stenobrocha 248]|uniref:Uncharacterized protein n=1 Tax=Drechslerella stenobrocha 248 TaxID=1043628 RepID=W7I0E0_9PEZI|nr:hypothetical protein DRE_04745 [Drechslerella stenobrocha 248]